MAISFVASTSVEEFSSDPGHTINVNVPAGTVDGDVMLSFRAINSITTTDSPPAGWTLIGEINHDITQALKSAVYYRVASSEPASYAWSHDSTNRRQCVVCQTWRGVDNATPLDVVFSAGSHAGSHPSDVSPPNQSITTVTDAARVIVFHYSRGDVGTPAPPTSYTSDANSMVGTDRTLRVANRSIVTAGLESPGDWLHSSTATNKDSQTWTLALKPAGAARSITDIDTDNTVLVAQTSVTITAVGLDASPSTQTITLGGQALTVTSWNSGNPIVTIPVNIALKLGRTDLQLSVTDDTGAVTFDNVTLSPEAGWEFVNFSGTAPGAGAESGYETVQTDFTYNLTSADQWIFESETGLSFDADTLPAVIPAATITSQYRYWRNGTGAMSAKTAYTIAQKPLISSGSFTAS